MLQEELTKMRTLEQEIMTAPSLDRRGLSEVRMRIAWLEDAIEMSKQRAEKLKASLGARFIERTFESFDESLQPKAFRICKDYADRFETIKSESRNSLLITGTYGTGKTHLAAAIVNELIDRGEFVKFDTYSGLLEQIKRSWDNGTDSLKSFKNVPLLVIDDFGKDKQTEWSDEILFGIINARYEKNLPTIITTNLSGGELLNRVGGAVYSRMSESYVGIRMNGEDIRKRGKYEQRTH